MSQNSLFFGLIRVAIGTQDTLPHAPSKEEWMDLYAMAKKQSLVGIVFAAIQRIANDNHDDDDNNHSALGMASEDLEPCEVMAKYWNMPEMLYLKWMGMAAKIQQRNEVVNKQCIALQKKMADDGLRSCILKGQGVASLYGDHLSGLRQSGDIDIYVDCGRRKAMAYLHNIGIKYTEWDYLHTNPHFYDNTEVELHYKISVTRNLLMNWRLQRFLKHKNEEFFKGTAVLPCGNIVVPSSWINIFFLMQHAYRHLLTEGLGLRQVMDCYFALNSITLNVEERYQLRNAVEKFGMHHFVSGLMWVMRNVFGMEMTRVPWVPNQHEGEFLLEEIMQSGNMGKMDSRFGKLTENKYSKLSLVSHRTMHLAMHYTSEALSAPLYYAWHFLWKRFVLLTDKQITK